MIGRAGTPAQRAADRIVRRLAAAEPDTVALAEVVALAVTVDAALLRAARRRFVPDRGPDLEADVWNSPLVRASNRGGVVFEAAVVERLLFRLARHQHRCEQARDVVVEEHGGLADRDAGWLPDTLRLEEELRYLAIVPDGHARARQLLGGIALRVGGEGADALPAWHEGLLSRLPSPLREVVGNEGGSAVARRGGPGRGRAPGRTVGLRLLDAALEVRPTTDGGAHELRLPDGPPPAVFVGRRLVPLESLPHIEPLDDGRAVTVQALDGASVTLHRGRREASPRRPDTLRGHGAALRGCAFSPDGTLLATTSDDRTVRLWDAATGVALRTLPGHAAAVTDCAFSPDGLLLASTDVAGRLLVRRVADGAVLAVAHAGAAGAGALGRRDPGVAPVGGRARAGAGLDACAFSPDGTLLAVAGAGGVVRLWDLRSSDALRGEPDAPGPGGGHDGEGGEPARALAAADHDVRCIAFSPDGTRLAAGGDDGTARVWDVDSGAVALSLAGHADAVEGCAFSPDGTALATSSRDRTLRLWDLDRGAEARTLRGHTNSVLSCAFSPDGTLLASTGNDRTVRLWDAAAGSLLRTSTDHGDWVRSCAFSPDGRTLATTSADRTARLWDPTRAAPLHRLEGHTSYVYSCAYSPDGRLLASASADRAVRLWDTATGTTTRVLSGHAASVEDCSFSPDGKVLASAGGDGTVRLWRVGTGDELTQLTAHGGRVHACTFSADGAVLATAGADGTVALWDPATGEVVLAIDTGGPVQRCAFSPDGRRLATTGEDQAVRLWDPTTGELLHTLVGHIREVLACAFSPDGRWLATASIDQTVRLWDPVAGRPLGTLRGHTSRIHACTFSPDGRWLATAGADHTVRLWDPRSATALHTFVGTESVLDCAFSPDGHVLAATGADRLVTVWDLLTERVAAKGDTVALWLGGGPGDAAAVAGAVAARPSTARLTPVVASGGGAIPGVLLAAGLAPAAVERLVVSTALAGGARRRLGIRWRDPLRPLRTQLARLRCEHAGDLRVPVDHPLDRYRFHAAVVDVITGELVVLPRDARKMKLAPDDIPLAELAVAASGLRREVTIGGRRFTSAHGRHFDPGPWYGGPPTTRLVLAVDPEDRHGAVPGRRFPSGLRVTSVTIPWLRAAGAAPPSRRRREVLARIGAQSFRAAQADDEPQPRRPTAGVARPLSARGTTDSGRSGTE